MPQVAKLHNLPVFETPIGYKYIADRMLETQVLLGGEESGGIGYGHHIPERDALLAALYLLETVVQTGQDLGEQYHQLRQKTGFTAVYDRIDLPLASMEVRAKLLTQLQTQPLKEIAGRSVIHCQTDDGYKFRLADQSWLLIRGFTAKRQRWIWCIKRSTGRKTGQILFNGRRFRLRSTH
jgi:phosphomannomutase